MCKKVMFLKMFQFTFFIDENKKEYYLSRIFKYTFNLIILVKGEINDIND